MDQAMWMFAVKHVVPFLKFKRNYLDRSSADLMACRFQQHMSTGALPSAVHISFDMHPRSCALHAASLMAIKQTTVVISVARPLGHMSCANSRCERQFHLAEAQSACHHLHWPSSSHPWTHWLCRYGQQSHPSAPHCQHHRWW